MDTVGAGALEAIVLAAGSGARFGGGKLLAPWRGGLLIEAALDAAFAAPVRSIHLVVGADPGVVPVALEHALTEGESGRLKLVTAADHAEGMAASLRAGIAALPPDAAGAFVFLGDMPQVPPQVAPDLAAALRAGAKAAVPVFEGRRGHPVLFAAEAFPALRRLSGDQGARGVLQGLGEAVAEVAAPTAGVLFDIDTPEALARGA
jgi:molybdenum cofactor cytidylyltransferase